jgi:class 3 adenylate cyclase
MKRKIAAILASDIAGYSRLVAEDEEDTLARFAGYRRAFEDFVAQHGGRVFNTAGDAILAEFPSAVDATRCAIDIQESMRTRNMGYAPSRQMLFRIGLTIGDVVERDGDLLGDGVNIAARLEGMAEPGGICVSRSVYEQVASKLSVPFQDIGFQEAKNLPQPIHAFRIRIGNAAAQAVSALKAQTPVRTASVSDRRDGGGFGTGVILGVLGVLLGISALGVVLWREFGRPDTTKPGQVAGIPAPPQLPPPVLPRELKPPATPEAPRTPPPAIAAQPQETPPVRPPQPATPEPPKAADTTPVEVPPTEPPPRQQAGRKPSAEQQAEKLAQSAPAPGSQPAKGGNTSQPAEPRVAVAPPVAAPAEPPAAPTPPKTVAIGPIEPPKLTPPPVVPQTPPRPAVPPGTSAADAFAIYSRAGGIIPDAKTAPELFHNARTYEARGEAANARTEYMKLAELGSDYLDPHLRFAALLRAQDGRAGAREIYARLAEGKGGRAAAIVHALQFEGAERRARIASLAGQHAFYGPVHMLLADEYAPERVGGETIGERRAQLAALQKFLEAERSGTLSQYFLDHSVLAQWLDRARSRQQALDQFLKTAKLEPTAQFILSNSGWLANVWVPEPATRISWRTSEKTDFRATGDTAFIDQRTGKPSPNLSFELPRDTPESTIELRYEDANGEMRGPFRVRFEPRAEIVKSQRDLLQRFSNNWLSFGDGGAQAKLVYFTQLATYRCAIAKVVLVFDDSPLPMQLRLPPCDLADPLKLPADYRPFMSMPGSAKSVTVEIAFADGTMSEKRKFERR